MKENCEIIYKGIDTNEEYEKTIRKVVNKCFEVEQLQNVNLYMSVTLTNPEEIRNINRQFRNIDQETDVLSFPMFEKEEIESMIANTVEKDKIEENEVSDILGDIVISIERVKKQAKEYGHSFERELSYMVVHGFYHLIGYDHMVEKDKKIMREKEENVLKKLNIYREVSSDVDINQNEEEKKK